MVRHFHHHPPGPQPAPPAPSTPDFKTIGHAAGSTVLHNRIPSIPGFKTSAAFLTSLGANLRLPDEQPFPSPMSTPPSMRGSTGSLSAPLPPPSPLSAAVMAHAASNNEGRSLEEPNDSSLDVKQDPLDGVPELSSYTATLEDDKIAALKLVADAVAQQRQVASRGLIANPILISVYTVIIAMSAQMLYKRPSDMLLVGTTWAGITMACLVFVRWMTGGYLFLAEEINWGWLGDDTILVVKWGEDIIGALVLAWDVEQKGRRKKVVRGLIRAWTVKLKYRGKGIGASLLEEAVHLVNQRGGDDLEFALDHAYAKRAMKPILNFNAPFDKRDTRAQTALDSVIASKAQFGKKR